MDNDPFTKSKKPEKTTILDQITRNVGDLGSRIRILEERYINLRKKTQVTEHSILESEKDFNDEIQSLREGLLELKSMLNEIHDKLDIIEGEIKNAVKRHEFKELDTYVSFWQPIKFKHAGEQNA
ncbi:hypothetical protein JW868_01400 [Candidatus Woesearchaeota archaeon]|nr:hypothetical protein [Candidatus Woesearchaeota archaeon]